MLVVEMSPNKNIITNPNPNWQWLTASNKLVAVNVFILKMKRTKLYVYDIFILFTLYKNQFF